MQKNNNMILNKIIDLSIELALHPHTTSCTLFMQNYYFIFYQFDVNWRIRGFLYHDKMEEVFAILNQVCDSPSLSISEEVVKYIEEHIQSHDDDQYQLKLKVSFSYFLLLMLLINNYNQEPIIIT